MSRKRLRILLDTSFLLPSLGFETDREILETMPCLINHEIHYSDLSLLEAMWKIMKHIKGREEIDIVLRGVDLLRRTFKHEELDERSVEIAFEMYAKGHRDLIDNLLYGISVSKQLSFLTIDKELLQFIKNKSFTNISISPDDIKNYCI